MPSVSALLKSIQHPTRREILNRLQNSTSPIAYTELLEFTDNSTGKLNYHLRSLDDIIDKTEMGYVLSNKGENIVRWLHNLVSEGDPHEMGRPTTETIFAKLYPVKVLIYKYILYYLTIIIPTLVSLSIIFSVADVWKEISSNWYLGFAIGLVLFSLLVIGLSILYYRSIWYHINETEVQAHKGIITLTHKIVSFRTITNIEVKKGPYDRLFGISTIQIHTAGNTATSGAEENLVGLVVADEIKETILERIRLLNPPDFASSVASSGKGSVKGLDKLLAELRDLNEEISR